MLARVRSALVTISRLPSLSKSRFNRPKARFVRVFFDTRLRVRLLDCDPQQSLSKIFRISPKAPFGLTRVSIYSITSALRSACCERNKTSACRVASAQFRVRTFFRRPCQLRGGAHLCEKSGKLCEVKAAWCLLDYRSVGPMSSSSESTLQRRPGRQIELSQHYRTSH